MSHPRIDSFGEGVPFGDVRVDTIPDSRARDVGAPRRTLGLTMHGSRVGCHRATTFAASEREHGAECGQFVNRLPVALLPSRRPPTTSLSRLVLALSPAAAVVRQVQLSVLHRQPRRVPREGSGVRRGRDHAVHARVGRVQVPSPGVV